MHVATPLLRRIRQPCARALSSAVGSVQQTGGTLGPVQKPDDVSTLRLYKDCMRLTYHIAAYVRQPILCAARPASCARGARVMPQALRWAC